MKHKVYLILFLFATINLSCKETKNDNEPVAPNDASLSLYFMDYPELAASEDIRLMMCYEQRGSRSGVSRRVYPEHFGGVYRNTLDRSKSVILLTDTSQPVREKLIKLCTLTPDKYIFKLCKYSMNELGSVYEQLASNSKVFAAHEIGSVGINEKYNSVKIRFKGKRDESRIAAFKTEILDSPMLEFWFESDGYPELEEWSQDIHLNENNSDIQNINQASRAAQTVVPGSMITTSRGAGTLSFFCYKRDNKDQLGFITVAHLVGGKGTGVYMYGKYLGIAEYVRNDNDLAFCSVFSGTYQNFSNSPLINEARYPQIGDKISIKGGNWSFFYNSVVTGVRVWVDFPNGLGLECSECIVGGLSGLIGPGDSGAIIKTEDNGVGGVLLGEQVFPQKIYYIPGAQVVSEMNVVLLHC